MPKENKNFEDTLMDSIDASLAEEDGDVSNEPIPGQAEVEAQDSTTDKPVEVEAPRKKQHEEDFDHLVRESLGENDQPAVDAAKVAKDAVEGTQPKPKGAVDGELRPVHGMDGVFSDKEGNLVDVNRNLIAQKGMQRRLYTANERFRSDNSQLVQENTQLRNRFTELSASAEAYRHVADMAVQHKITNEELRDSIQIVSMFKVNPAAAAKEVLARAMALGYNLTQIVGEEVGDSVDMVALSRMLTNNQQAPNGQPAQQSQETYDPVRVRYEAFLQRFPDARQHEDAIVNLMHSQNIDETTAFMRLRQFADDNNLDIRQPLGPQIEAVQRAHAAQNPQTQQPAQRRTTPMTMTGGGTHTATVQGAQSVNRSVQGGANDSWDNLIRDSMSSSKS